MWGAVLACWYWLHQGARSRARLLHRLASRYGGSIRTRFSPGSLTREAVELVFVHMAGRAPCRMRVGFSVPFLSGTRPGTVFELELPEPSFGPVPGDWFRGDDAAGRGLFLAGANATAAWVRFAALLPRNARPELRWRDARLRLFLPALLGVEDELWAEHCLGFLREVAGLTATMEQA